jgi:hypothetical protein
MKILTRASCEWHSDGEAQVRQGEKRRRMEEEMARVERKEREAHSFEDLKDEDIDKSEL